MAPSLPRTLLTRTLLPKQPIQNQTRNYETARRQRKLLTAAPTPLGGSPLAPRTGGTGRSRQPSLPAEDRIIYNPPPSAPNVYHTPLKFLPRDDLRRQHLLQQRQRTQGGSQAAPVSEPSLVRLPPALRVPYQKAYHVTPAQVEEMRVLRREDETRWTVGRLAEKFGCSNLFVSMCVGKPSEERSRMLRNKDKTMRGLWGPRRREARRLRERRKEAWGRDE